ncbi:MULTISPECIES: heme-binding protein [unclassified Bradyrhizobium]|uniref:GlcG/HbpS family heme-binding protein n=1 Tax=unclassified Bradyrhizobium TaxID=2631580 RepID=UPI0029168019|nr:MULTISPECIES: heme-binding protein [unclassified Bradyrhizobium]
MAVGVMVLRPLLAVVLLLGPAFVARADEPTWTRRIIAPDTALKAAQAALAECRKRGWQATVTVSDPSGLALVTLRDRFAGWHTLEAATGKARTAASWREATSTLAARLARPDAPERAIVNVPSVVMVGGGMPIEAAGQQVGAIGVSGAPGGDNDDICATAGIEAIAADIAF